MTNMWKIIAMCMSDRVALIFFLKNEIMLTNQCKDEHPIKK